MGLPEEFRSDKSLFHIVPILYEGEVTFARGASKGSLEIISSSKNIEYYDIRYGIEPYKEGIKTHRPIDLRSENSEEAVKKIKNYISSINGFVISIGGDHSITIGSVKGHETKEQFDIVVLDAHTDFRYSWNNDMYNHACVNRRLVNDHDIVVIGVRSADKDELESIRQDKRISIIQKKDDNSIKQIIKKLSDRIYLSVDIDVLDPSIIRGTGTPEPGGMSWNEIIKVLEIIFSSKKVIGCDIVEYIPKDHTESYTVAKLIHTMMAQKLVFDKN